MNQANIAFYCQNLAKSGFIDPISNEEFQYNEFLESLISKLKKNGDENQENINSELKLIRANIWGDFHNRVFENGKEMLQYENQITRDNKEPMKLDEYLCFLEESEYSYEIYKIERMQKWDNKKPTKIV